MLAKKSRKISSTHPGPRPPYHYQPLWHLDVAKNWLVTLNVPVIQKFSMPVPTGQVLPKNVVSSHPNQLTPQSTHSDLCGSYHEAAPGSSGKTKLAMFTKALGRTISQTVVTSLVVIVSILLPNFKRVMGF
ncbi:hypothetical protein PGT21_015661 [Puccinia graminis f. sp. tritici]|uniref:Uncharacterized protein n=1 Tax=Puccinia graminis f. sp. tritici TaxID=56615 RepID=A0A5B0MET9_PUCGR|nr:hypothetical protein PGT21_015661 [Puccinia graminis f. sp. tritici]